MNAKQKDKIIQTIKRDCTLSGKNFDGEGGFCIVGGLIIESGEAIPPNNQGSGLDALPPELLRHLQHFYGLTYHQLRQMQEINDNVCNGPTPEADVKQTQERRKRLREFVERQPVSLE